MTEQEQVHRHNLARVIDWLRRIALSNPGAGYEEQINSIQWAMGSAQVRSAAPDMLEALEKLIAIGPKGGKPDIRTHPKAYRNWCQFELAKKTAAKARGAP